METSTTLIRELRERTSCGVKDCKEALTQSDNDIEKAIEYLRKKGLASAAKKTTRDTNAGIIFSYVHTGGQIGVLLELNCETDFVANNSDFQALGKDLCMQVCAMNPIAITREAIPQEIIDREKAIYEEQIPANKPPKVKQTMLEGKLTKFYQESSLLEQAFIKDDKRTVEEVIKEKIAVFKENITIKRFIRLERGEKIDSAKKDNV